MQYTLSDIRGCYQAIRAIALIVGCETSLGWAAEGTSHGMAIRKRTIKNLGLHDSILCGFDEMTANLPVFEQDHIAYYLQDFLPGITAGDIQRMRIEPSAGTITKRPDLMNLMKSPLLSKEVEYAAPRKAILERQKQHYKASDLAGILHEIAGLAMSIGVLPAMDDEALLLGEDERGRIRDLLAAGDFRPLKSTGEVGINYACRYVSKLLPGFSLDTMVRLLRNPEDLAPRPLPVALTLEQLGRMKCELRQVVGERTPTGCDWEKENGEDKARDTRDYDEIEAIRTVEEALQFLKCNCQQEGDWLAWCGVLDPLGEFDAEDESPESQMKFMQYVMVTYGVTPEAFDLPPAGEQFHLNSQ